MLVIALESLLADSAKGLRSRLVKPPCHLAFTCASNRSTEVCRPCKAGHLHLLPAYTVASCAPSSHGCLARAAAGCEAHHAAWHADAGAPPGLERAQGSSAWLLAGAAGLGAGLISPTATPYAPRGAPRRPSGDGAPSLMGWLARMLRGEHRRSGSDGGDWRDDDAERGAADGWGASGVADPLSEFVLHHI